MHRACKLQRFKSRVLSLDIDHDLFALWSAKNAIYYDSQQCGML